MSRVSFYLAVSPNGFGGVQARLHTQTSGKSDSAGGWQALAPGAASHGCGENQEKQHEGNVKFMLPA
jgi:hypothetical protein